MTSLGDRFCQVTESWEAAQGSREFPADPWETWQLWTSTFPSHIWNSPCQSPVQDSCRATENIITVEFSYYFSLNLKEIKPSYSTEEEENANPGKEFKAQKISDVVFNQLPPLQKTVASRTWENLVLWCSLAGAGPQTTTLETTRLWKLNTNQEYSLKEILYVNTQEFESKHFLTICRNKTNIFYSHLQCP